MLLIFVAGQTTVYILALRKLRSAYFYLKYFAVFGFAFSLFVTFTMSPYAVLPMAIYAGGYYVFASLFKESSEGLQTLPQSPTPL